MLLATPLVGGSARLLGGTFSAWSEPARGLSRALLAMVGARLSSALLNLTLGNSVHPIQLQSLNVGLGALGAYIYVKSVKALLRVRYDADGRGRHGDVV